MSELKTCPKCGDDVKGYVTGGIAAFGCGEYGFDVDCGCGISYSTGCVYETPEEAEEMGSTAWNNRSERTCENMAEQCFREAYNAFLCSHCGTKTAFTNVDYCPSCGAKVVSE